MATVEIKIKDVESMEAIVMAMQKNGHKCDSFIHWGKNGIDYFTIQFDAQLVSANISKQTALALEAIGKKAHGAE